MTRLWTTLRLDLARRLPLRFDPRPLAEDLRRVERELFPRGSGGDWDAVALWEPGCGIRHRTAAAHFPKRAPAPLLASFRSVLAALPGRKARARLIRLEAGAYGQLHIDQTYRGSYRNPLRVHVPIVTNDRVYFLVNGQRVRMAPGQAWLVNVLLPHEVFNLGREPRTHLMIDVEPNDDLARLVESAIRVQDRPTPARLRAGRRAARTYLAGADAESRRAFVAREMMLADHALCPRY